MRTTRMILAALSALPLVAGTAAAAHAAPVTMLLAMAPSGAGATLRGASVPLDAWFNSDTLCGDEIAPEQWFLDGHVIDTPSQVSGYQDGTLPGNPTSDATHWSWIWDSTTAANGLHTLTLSYACGSGEPGWGGDVMASVQVQVNNAPVGIVFSDPQGRVVHGTDDLLTVTVAPQGSPIRSVSFGGDLVPASQQSDNQAPYTSDLDLLDAHNGSHTISVQVTDAAGIVSTARLSLAVNNTTTLQLSGPGKVRLSSEVTIKVASTMRFRAGQKVLLQQKVSGQWVNVAHATIPSSGKTSITGGFRSVGRKYLRITSASASFWPGTSKVVSIVCY